MATVLSKKGQIVLPLIVCHRLQISPGDFFGVSVEDEQTIVLRRVSQPANRGLGDHLLACPFPFSIPDRDAYDTPPISL